MQVLKFGGSSLFDSEAIRHVAGIIREHLETDRILVVCSACGGVTNALVRVVEQARSGSATEALHEFDAIATRHSEIAAELCFAGRGPIEAADIEELTSATRALISDIASTSADAEWSDAILSYGERVSVRLVASALSRGGAAAQAVDASELIVTDERFGHATPLPIETELQSSRVLQPLIAAGVVPVVTGFIGASRDGRITTLGRNSSDFSATILANAIGADEVSIWTDVDGVFDRDPRTAEETAVLLDELSYEDALRLAANGAKVLHPRTIEPLVKKGIALRIRNTFNHRHPGTWIGPDLRSAVA